METLSIISNIIGIFTFFGSISFISWKVYEEHKKWNHGICMQSGKEWIYHKIDKNGDRFFSDGNNNYLKISYAFNFTSFEN